MSTAVPEIQARSGARVPVRWRKEVERILITDRKIAWRIRQMSRDIVRDFTGREMVVVSLLNGTVMFLGDLIRHRSEEHTSERSSVLVRSRGASGKCPGTLCAILRAGKWSSSRCSTGR